MAHAGVARSPIFDDGSFEYVSFPDEDSSQEYSSLAQRFVKSGVHNTHLDPDWKNLTYGDFCKNPRARTLLSAKIDDTLLFWGLLWRVPNRTSSVWESREKGWYLLGALRVQCILESAESLQSLPRDQQVRLLPNAHVHDGCVENRPKVRVFLGNRSHSAKFDYGVDLGIYKERSLLRDVVLAKDGRQLQWYERPRWNSAIRSCRPILDLDDAGDTKRAKILQKSIKARNPSLDLLAGF